MSINAEALTKLQSDFLRVTGKKCPDFYCPIMNEFGMGPRGLMAGHILPQCIQSASRATVIQSADVHNGFGKIEAVLCNFLNRPYYEVTELYKRARGLTITGSSGVPAPAFFPKKKAAPPFPQISLTDQKGEIIAVPFVKTSMDRMNEFDGPVDVEGEIVFSVPALVVSLIKSAHLALFKLTGYEWVLNPAGQYIGKRLAKLVDHDADAEAIKQLANELPNCFKMVPGPAVSEDTLSSRGQFSVSSSLLLPLHHRTIQCQFIIIASLASSRRTIQRGQVSVSLSLLLPLHQVGKLDSWEDFQDRQAMT